MPQNTTIDVETNWTLLTDADVTEVTFQNIGVGAFYLSGTNGAGTPPQAGASGILYVSGQGEAKRALADLFPGVSGANRLWAKGTDTATKAFVSHS